MTRFQKTLPAICAALLASPALAQSSVTIYGKVDFGLVVDKGSPSGKAVRLGSGVAATSRLGFKGIEDLGNGYKAFFQLETGYCGDSAAGAPNFCSGSNNFMGRQSHGDLTGPFGSISAGRQYTLGFTTFWTADPFGTGLAGRLNNTNGKDYIVDPSGTRINNSVIYTTPVLAGVTVSGEIGLGEQPGNWRSSRELGAALNYAVGPAFASLTWYSQNTAQGDHPADQNVQFGATYDFGIVKLHGLAQKVKGSPVGAPRIDVMNLMVGATVPIGPGSLLASIVRHDDRASADRDARQFGVGYLYPLSRRTSIYTAFAHIVNRNGAGYFVGNGTETGTGNSGFDLGVLTSF